MFFIFGLLPWIVHVILTYFVANEVRFDDIYAYVIGISVIVFGISFLMNMVTYDISSVRFLK